MAAVSAFVGTPLAVRAPRTVAKRQQLSVQASSAGPKKARTPPAGAPHERAGLGALRSTAGVAARRQQARS